MHFLKTILVFILCPLATFSQNTIITGSTSQFTGEKLIFYEFNERILHTRTEVFEIIPDEKGVFIAEFEIEETKFLFTDYGAFRYYFYAEPGVSYSMVLPALQKKSPAQEANPFFIPSTIPLEVRLQSIEKNNLCLELNDAIRGYDNAFEPFYNSQILRYYSAGNSRIKSDSFNLATIPSLPLCNAEYFSEYTHFKRGILEFTVSQFDLNQIINVYFADKPVRLSNPAWWDLFEKVFDRYFSFLVKKPGFENLYLLMDDNNYSSLDSLLKMDTSLQNDTLRGLVLIREIHHEFFDGSLAQTTLAALLDSVTEKSNAIPCRNLAREVKQKNTKLLPGSASPSFQVIEASGERYNEENFRGKYIYLGFCHPNSITCMKEFEYLKYLGKKYTKQLTIITVFDDIRPEELRTIKEQNNYSWLLTGNEKNGDVFDDYGVRATPQFFLIAPDGTFLLSPAPMPSEGFERVFFSIIREKGDL